MAELHVEIPDSKIREIYDNLPEAHRAMTLVEIVGEALAVFNWTLKEQRNNRRIAAYDKNQVTMLKSATIGDPIQPSSSNDGELVTNEG